MTLATTVRSPSSAGPCRARSCSPRSTRCRAAGSWPGSGPGSSARDYEAAGVPFEERWPRFDDSIGALRRCRAATSAAPSQPAWSRGPRRGIASWGSPRGLRRVARLGDGWLASGYNTTPERFGACRAALPGCAPERDRDDVAVRDRGPRGGRADARRRARPDARPQRRRAARAGAADRRRPRTARSGSARSGRRAPSGSSCGRWRTSCEQLERFRADVVPLVR